ncbi:ATP-binding cassette domain-containing protein [Mucilaginibacter boryungensis]|uniref:ATP-binding cassette domain-containing protein n=2 Tax=Mucilaginibacter boryungensis TaxID=768480 RepID=A0ABR9XIB4_9SPHI|nr:ATP-binding cassette domain-containing protein [Mucilaginibacter boryungensis]MBE9667122.1 ATP-binding cassette domain-containing protein [Mucilaginibacter boryungensis]
MSSLLISVNEGSISYPAVTVLTDVSFEINKGQHWAFIGESGSGKTSLLNIIAGNLILKKGVITRVFTDDTKNNSDFHHHIAFVSAKHHFRNLSNTSDFYYQQRYNSSDSEDALTVADYLNDIQSDDSISHYWNYDKATALLKLSTLADKQLIKLSNGETKRLMIAAALLKNPALLLLDNPLAGLDTQTRAEFNAIINQIAASGITIIMATSPYEVPEAITHIGTLKNGRFSSFSKDQFKADGLFVESSATENLDLLALLYDYPADNYTDIVRMSNVNIRYGNKLILNNINWQIKQGERWALLGPNGAGKSTLLSLINGDNPQAYANNIILFDKKRGSGESIWDIKKRTGFISPELYQYFPADSSCLQAIESGYYDTTGLFRPSDKAKAAHALQWMKMLEIAQYARQLLKNIPASAQRLCLLARAMVKSPALLILDEPCQGMDDHQISHFKALIDAICQQTNITLIYVTHYAEHIPNSISKTLKLDSGLIIGD